MQSIKKALAKNAGAFIIHILFSRLFGISGVNCKDTRGSDHEKKRSEDEWRNRK